jgi:hypothetical protein
MSLSQDIVNAFVFWFDLTYYVIIYSIPLLILLFIIILVLGLIYLIKKNVLLEKEKQTYHKRKNNSPNDYSSGDESTYDEKKDLFDNKLTEDV